MILKRDREEVSMPWRAFGDSEAGCGQAEVDRIHAGFNALAGVRGFGVDGPELVPEYRFQFQCPGGRSGIRRL